MSHVDPTEQGGVTLQASDAGLLEAFHQHCVPFLEAFLILRHVFPRELLVRQHGGQENLHGAHERRGVKNGAGVDLVADEMDVLFVDECEEEIQFLSGQRCSQWIRRIRHQNTLHFKVAFLCFLESVPGVGETEHESFISRGCAGGEDELVGVEGDLVPSDFRHELNHSVLERRKAVIILEQCELSENGIPVILERGGVRVLSHPRLKKIERELVLRQPHLDDPFRIPGLIVRILLVLLPSQEVR
nr:hypothetical protein EUGRSUZ_H02339 [Ipomoea batatas]GMC64041.1 hypothetical protein EUGRSUZ_H02339 [Ipomoea batatas]